MEYSLTTGKYTYFIYSGNKMIAEETDGVVRYHHSDHLGSTRLVTDASGNKVAEYKFKPYGETDSYAGTFSTNYQFTGKPVNADVGLAYYGARWYDPETGRFITADTYTNMPDDERVLFGQSGLDEVLNKGFDNPQSYNRYSYCLNSPLRYTDSNGHEIATATMAFTAVAAASIGVAAVVCVPEVVAVVALVCFITADCFLYDNVQSNNKVEARKEEAEHTKNARPSTRNKHEEGKTRKLKDKNGEKGDRKRPYRKSGKNVVAINPMDNAQDNQSNQSSNNAKQGTQGTEA